MSDLIPPLKTCPDCETEKPAAEFRRNADRPDGLAFYCRECVSRRERAAYRRRQERIGRTVRERMETPEGHKWCPGCKSVRPLGEWGRNKRSRDGFNSYCKECRKAQSARDYLRKTHKLTPEDVEHMIRKQGGVCMICLSAPAKHVDHDHVTGERRGVLCFMCNVGLGQFKDDAWVLRRAIEYLAGGLLGLRLKEDGGFEVAEVRRATGPVRDAWDDRDFTLLDARIRGDSGDPWESDVDVAPAGPCELRFPPLDLSEPEAGAPPTPGPPHPPGPPPPPEYAFS